MKQRVMGRRDFLTAGYAGLVGGGLGLNASALAKQAVSEIPREPNDRLATYMRMLAVLNGETCLATEGILFGRPAEALAEPLCGFVTLVTVKTARSAPDLFNTHQREAIVFVDLKSGERLETFDNPYTGERVTPFGHISSIYTISFDAYGSYSGARPAVRTGDWPLIWRETGDALVVIETRHNRAAAGFAENEFPRAYGGPERLSTDTFTFESSLSDLAALEETFVPARTRLLTEGPWQYWLMMGRRPGTMIWEGAGLKYRRVADAPPRTLRLIDEAYPGFTRDPWGAPSQDFGTLAQMRRLKAQGRL